jgi:actin-related protein
MQWFKNESGHIFSFHTHVFLLKHEIRQESLNQFCKYPMEHGIVQDWNDMERIWQYIYSKDQLQTFSEEVCVKMCPLFFSSCVIRHLLDQTMVH